MLRGLHFQNKSKATTQVVCSRV
ncbi:hypothetical protein [Agarivorans sp. JK6]